MKIAIPPVLVLALGMASVSLAAEGVWTRKADMPMAIGFLSTSVVDGKIYVIGGAADAGTAVSTVHTYEPALDIWAKVADIPEPRSGLSTSVVDGKIYVIGGATSPFGAALARVLEYDPVTNIWSGKANMPTPRAYLCTAIVNGKIYAIGGAQTLRGPGLPVVEVYDPATDIWTRKAPMPTARYTHSIGVADGKIYAVGGMTRMVDVVGLSTVEAYEPATDTWTKKSEMPTPRWGLSASAVGGKIYSIGGHSGSGGTDVLQVVEVYNPVTDTWTQREDMPTPRRGGSTSVLDGKIYAIGGVSGNPGLGLPAVEEYDPNPLVVDFNGDGIVDGADMRLMVDHWHTDEPLYDIAPLPSGDGIVDVQDLIVLAEHLFEDYRLAAHWKLDEAEGAVASDSIGGKDGTLVGAPLWQPSMGHADGALEFDGTDDFVSTGFTLNPVEGSFSVLAWIKGGAPGQIIISQTDVTSGRNTVFGSTWLGTDPSGGKLITTLMEIPFGPLESETVITDGQWRHIGLVYDLDALSRHLYVDGVEVAADANPVGGVASDGGLYFGVGKNLESGSFFSGLIDDIRIYLLALNAEEIAVLVR